MQTKNKKRPTAQERVHIEQVKKLPCSVCDEPGPSEAHEIVPGAWWLIVALCWSCHRDQFNGWHGQRRIWLVKKMDELSALAVTLKRLFTGG